MSLKKDGCTLMLQPFPCQFNYYEGKGYVSFSIRGALPCKPQAVRLRHTNT